MPEYSIVDLATDHNLATLVASQDRVGVDTEFMRERTFFSQLCLLQISADSQIVCADPLNLDNASKERGDAFWQAMMKPLWVLHSGRQDLEVVYQTAGLLPQSVFDTQIAAAFLGYQPQIGYANLVTELFDVELAKSHTRADWSKRPLSDAIMTYAAEDVEYLLPAHDLLSARLDKLGRLEWVTQDSADLLDASLYQSDPDKAIERLKGARNLRGRARAAAEQLAAWREREALRTNRPRQWIMRDPVVLEIAEAAPHDSDDLGQISGLAERTIRRAGAQLLQIVADSARCGSEYRPPARPDEKQKAMLARMLQIVSDRAQELGIASELLAPRKELSSASLGNRDSRVFGGWRREIVGAALLELLENA